MDRFFINFQEQIQLFFKSIVKVQQEVTTQTSEIIEKVVKEPNLKTTQGSYDEEE